MFSDLHKKVCFMYGKLSLPGQYCWAAAKPISEQGSVWSFLDVLAVQPAQEVA
jgi:hypothetical protein